MVRSNSMDLPSLTSHVHLLGVVVAPPLVIAWTLVCRDADTLIEERARGTVTPGDTLSQTLLWHDGVERRTRLRADGRALRVNHVGWTLLGCKGVKIYSLRQKDQRRWIKSNVNYTWASYKWLPASRCNKVQSGTKTPCCHMLCPRLRHEIIGTFMSFLEKSWHPVQCWATVLSYRPTKWHNLN